MQKLQDRADQFYGDTHAKNPAQGLAKGLGSMAKGVYGGVASILVVPVMGAKQDGAVGLAKGTVSGIGGLLMLPVGGVVQGARQISSGFYHTPDALRTMMSKDENETMAETKGSVVDEDPSAEAQNAANYAAARHTVLAAAALGESTPGGGQKAEEREKRFAVESGLYDTLNLNPSATYSEIQRNYLRLSQQFHPDKYPGDKDVEQRFEEISKAYQVLGNPVSREKYDRYGAASLTSDFVEPGAFLTAQFGSDAFSPYVGELVISFCAGRESSKEEIDLFQVKREKELAGLLLQRLDKWLQGDEEGFVEAMMVEAEKLHSAPFGDRMLLCVGDVYYRTAQVLLGLSSPLGIPGYVSLFGDRSHQVKSRFGAIDAAFSIQKMKEKAEKEGKEELDEEDVSKFLQDVWLVSVVDIESTVQKVVEMVVKDPIIPDKAVRMRRAKGIMKLGKVFQHGAAPPTAPAQPPK